MDLIIYHNPSRGTSRNTLAVIRNPEIEPHVIESLKGWPFGEEPEDGERVTDEGGRQVSLA